MTSHKKMITYLWNFSFCFFTIHNIWSFWINTSHFEIDAWNFWYFNLMNKPLALGHHTFSIQVVFPFFQSNTSRCDGFCKSLSLFILRFTFVELFKQKHKKVGRYIGISLRMYQNQHDYWLIIHDKFKDLFITVT